jgi:ferritin
MVSSSIFVSSLIIILFSPFIFGDELNDVYETQIQKEFLASNIYLTFAHRLAAHGVYHGFANFFFESAEEEREHGKKLIDFYNVRNIEVRLKDINIDDETAKMVDLTKMIYAAEKLEQQVFENMIQVRFAATQKQDYATAHFIENVMLEEQTTALKYMHDLVKRIERRTESTTVLLQMMDQDLRKKQVKKP